MIDPPVGLPAIIATFGDVFSFVDDTGHLKPEWQEQYLATANLAYPLALSWDVNVKVNRILCHKLLVETFESVFQEIADRSMQDKVVTYGGCFNFRQQRTGTKLSTHAWGIAIDLNPATNEQGTRGNMDDDVVTLFRVLGFKWGGDWLGNKCDPQHFQFATGY